MWGAKPPTFLKACQSPRGRPDLTNVPSKIRPDCIQVHNLRNDLPGSFSLTYVAFFKPEPLGTFLGPTLAEKLPKTKNMK